MEFETPIDYDVIINYYDNKTYRETLRKIFRMENQHRKEGSKIIFNNGEIMDINDIDDETLDEINFDDTVYDDCFSHIWEMTKNVKGMVELYEWSAGNFMSMDQSVGIANLLNYNYLPRFYKLLCKIYKTGIEPTDEELQFPL